MSPPITWRTVTGRYVEPDGDPVVGQLRFVPSDPVYDAGGNLVVPPVPVFAVLDPAGAVSVELACTDTAGVTPSGWSWTLTELFAGGREVRFQIPAASPPVVRLADLLPATVTQPVTAYATAASAAALDARVTAVEAQSAVTFAAVGLHPFMLGGI